MPEAIYTEICYKPSNYSKSDSVATSFALQVPRMPTEGVTLVTGEELEAGKVIFCTTKPAPNTQFLPPVCSNERGYVKVNPE